MYSTRDLIKSDLSNKSWNLIAHIEADDPVDALDSFMGAGRSEDPGATSGIRLRHA